MAKKRHFTTATTVVAYGRGKLQTGFVYAGFYAKKIRKVIFSHLRYVFIAGDLTIEDVLRDTGELNKVLYEQVFEKFKASKEDVVKIEIDYEIEKGRIKWLWDTLKVRVWKAVEGT